MCLFLPILVIPCVFFHLYLFFPFLFLIVSPLYLLSLSAFCFTVCFRTSPSLCSLVLSRTFPLSFSPFCYVLSFDLFFLFFFLTFWRSNSFHSHVSSSLSFLRLPLFIFFPLFFLSIPLSCILFSFFCRYFLGSVLQFSPLVTFITYLYHFPSFSASP